MFVKDWKVSRRASRFAETISEIEYRLRELKNQNGNAESIHQDISKEIKSLQTRLATFQKQVDNAYFKVRPEARDERPVMESTTLWDFPTQNYGTIKKGDSKFQGVTPAFIIYNMIQRYTEPNDMVLDPMCGSGTTIDVCHEEGRQAIGYDINPTRTDIIKNDARSIPLPDESVDMVFIDSPYGDNVDYSDEPECIGKISAEDDEFYNSLQQVAAELYRVLKPGKALGWLIGDQWVKRKFTPVGFYIYRMLTAGVGFISIDLICVTRRNQSSNTGIWHYRAIKHNFFLRGFKHLIIVRKPEVGEQQGNEINRPAWQRYK